MTGGLWDGVHPSPKVPGLPSMGVMRDFPTTLTGNDGGSRATLMRSSGTLPVMCPDKVEGRISEVA